MDIAATHVGVPELLNEDRLQYALDAVEMTFGGVEMYPTLFQKAAVYAHHIITGHVFVDGNKRTGMGSAFEFLRMNGLDPPDNLDDEIIALGFAIADGSEREIGAIAERMRAWYFDE